MQPDTRSRARSMMRRELADAAFEVLAERGYNAVTVEELVRAIGTSRATFFRYFDAKEDVVLMTAAPDERDIAAVVAAAEVPVDDQTDAVFRILGETLPPVGEQTKRLRARVLMITANPALGARLAGRRGARQAEFAAALSGSSASPADAQVYAAIAFACLDVAWRSWARDDSSDLQLYYDDAVQRARTLMGRQEK
ncbi:TetR family transcriptional regulator [Rathayibacter sp. SD072]|uniref:TetR family transcriptional regulator n=1 Tax=Rathayibacter sp. SD072 TaxID=2781731 RepID=UPI001A9733D1|nr:TetR family transcriptional regulator [Rathayibacter sp. SD072]MBO0982609.1 TetR/AcrR family transcriptional regulator [Rathayibacter sp. SD072]